MFENLSERLSGVVGKLRGKGRLSEENIQDALRQVRMALLEADVALPVVKDVMSVLKEKALGAEFSKSLTPGQAFIKMVNDELVRVMGQANESLDLSAHLQRFVLLAGLQARVKPPPQVNSLVYSLKSRKRRCCLPVLTSIVQPPSPA